MSKRCQVPLNFLKENVKATDNILMREKLLWKVGSANSLKYNNLAGKKACMKYKKRRAT